MSGPSPVSRGSRQPVSSTSDPLKKGAIGKSRSGRWVCVEHSGEERPLSVVQRVKLGLLRLRDAVTGSTAKPLQWNQLPDGLKGKLESVMVGSEILPVPLVELPPAVPLANLPDTHLSLSDAILRMRTAQGNIGELFAKGINRIPSDQRSPLNHYDWTSTDPEECKRYYLDTLQQLEVDIAAGLNGEQELAQILRSSISKLRLLGGVLNEGEKAGVAHEPALEESYAAVLQFLIRLEEVVQGRADFNIRQPAKFTAVQLSKMVGQDLQQADLDRHPQLASEIQRLTRALFIDQISLHGSEIDQHRQRQQQFLTRVLHMYGDMAAAVRNYPQDKRLARIVSSRLQAWDTHLDAYGRAGTDIDGLEIVDAQNLFSLAAADSDLLKYWSELSDLTSEQYANQAKIRAAEIAGL